MADIDKTPNTDDDSTNRNDSVAKELIEIVRPYRFETNTYHAAPKKEMY